MRIKTGVAVEQSRAANSVVVLYLLNLVCLIWTLSTRLESLAIAIELAAAVPACTAPTELTAKGSEEIVEERVGRWTGNLLDNSFACHVSIIVGNEEEYFSTTLLLLPLDGHGDDGEEEEKVHIFHLSPQGIIIIRQLKHCPGNNNFYLLRWKWKTRRPLASNLLANIRSIVTRPPQRRLRQILDFLHLGKLNKHNQS